MNFNTTEIIKGKKNPSTQAARRHLCLMSELCPAQEAQPLVMCPALGPLPTPLLLKMDKQVTVLFQPAKESTLSVLLGSQSILGVKNTNST